MIASPLVRKMPSPERSERTDQRPMMNQDADIERVRRMAGGDETALRELFAQYGQRLYAYALRLCADPATAEDVVQDTLVAAWRSAGRFRGEGRVAAWLLGIVHHTAMKALRHLSQPITDEMEDNLAASTPLPEEQVQVGEQAERLRRALNKLSPEQRGVLELVFYQGLSLNEAADVCACPLGTVKSRLSHARQQLRGVLSRLEAGGEE